MMIKKTKKFTLIELLVVITVLAILMSLFVPALRRTLYTVRSTACVTNFKSMGLGFMQYCDDNDDMYPQLGGPRGSIYETSLVSGRNASAVLHRDTQGPMLPYNDGLGMRGPNGNFMCPQAVTDLHPETNANNMTYYGFFFQDVSSLGWRYDWLPYRPGCLANSSRCPNGACYGPPVSGDMKYMMVRLGDSWKFGTAMTGRYNRGGVKDLNYNVVATDFSIYGDGVETNHVWNPNEEILHFGGTWKPRVLKQSNGNTYNRSSTEECIINLLMDDGSVQSRKLWFQQVRTGGEDGWNFRGSGGAGREQWLMPLNLGTP